MIVNLPAEAKILVANLLAEAEEKAYKKGFSEGYNAGFIEHKFLPF